LSDRYGRRPVLLIGFSGLALSFFVTGLATALWMLLVVRLFSGAMPVEYRWPTPTSPTSRRRPSGPKSFGRLGAMLGMGFILGPCSAAARGISLHLPFFVAGSLSIVNWLYGYSCCPSPCRRAAPAVRAARGESDSARCGLGELKGVGLLVVVVALSGLAQFMTHTPGVLFTPQVRLGPTQNGWSLFAIGVMSVLVQGVFLSRLLKRFSPQRLTVMGWSRRACATSPGARARGWMIFAVMAMNVFGFTVSAAVQEPDLERRRPTTQGRTAGASVRSTA